MKVPQSTGIPGWLCLTRDEHGNPVSLLVQRREGNPKIMRVRCVLDERCYEDTIFRIEYTSTSIYLADVWMWNAFQMFNATNFLFRQKFLEDVYTQMYTNCPQFQSHEIQLRTGVTDIRGYEYYSDRIGERGVFVESNDIFEICATEIPDVYKLSNGGYLRVRTLKLSRYLRTLGKTFKLKCHQNEDNTWSPVELSQ